MKYDLVIKVSDLTVVTVGDYTIDKIRDRLDRDWREGYRVLLDFKGLAITGAGMLGKLDYLFQTMAKYNCDVANVNEDVENEYIAYLGGNYYLIEGIYEGNEKDYYQYFKKMLELNEYGLMVKDNYYTRDVVKKTVIKPLKMDNQYFYYQELKSGYAEPKYLLTEDSDKIFNEHRVSNSDLLKREYCFRFPVKGKESEVVELFNHILASKSAV